MLHRLLPILLAASLYGQTTTITPTIAASVPAGGSATLTVSCTGCQAQSVTAVQWTITLPAGVSLGAPVAASAWAAAGNSGYCNPANGTCIVAGGTAVVADGAVATIPLTFATAGSDSLALSGLFAAAEINGAGVNVNGMISGSPAAIKVLSPCDLNSDGVVNTADVQILINAALGITACPISGITCNLVAVINEIIAANGGACKN